MQNNFKILLLSILIGCASYHTEAQENNGANTKNYTIEKCVNQFSSNLVDSTKVGYQYWFADKHFLDGRTLKMSVVAPHKSTHAPHKHVEDEFFFVLEGKAEFYLDGETVEVMPYTSLYCPSNRMHGIKNIGDTELKYLVIKKYPKDKI